MQWRVLDWYTVTIRLAPPAVFTFELWIVKDVGDSDESEKRQQFESLHMSNKSRGCKMERRHCFVLAACTRLSLFTPPPLSNPRHHLLHHRDHHLLHHRDLHRHQLWRQLSLRNHQWWHLWGCTVLMYGPIRPLCPNLLCTIFIVIPLYHHHYHHHHKSANVWSNQVPMASTPIYSAWLLSVLWFLQLCPLDKRPLVNTGLKTYRSLQSLLPYLIILQLYHYNER